MGLNPHSSSKRDWNEVAFLMEAFETVNSVKVVVTFQHILTDGIGDLLVTLTAVTTEDAPVEVANLASVQFNARSTELVSISALFTHGLYRLDFELGQQEFNRC